MNRPKRQKSPMETAVLLLTKQPLARIALIKKLNEKGFSLKDSENAAAECERYGYINDRMIAEAKVSIMRDRGDGARKIKLNLRLKGFEKEMIDNAFKVDDKNSERSEFSVAMEALRRKKMAFEREPDLIKRKTKALRTLASKGFSAGISYQAISAFFHSSDDDFSGEEFP